MRALVDKSVGGYLTGMADAARQLGLFVLAELCYEAVRGIADGARDQAIANGQNVISLEKGLHTFFEPNLQSLFINHRWIVDFANFMYMNSHFVVTTAFLVWLYLFRNQNFYFVRNMFMVAMGLAVDRLRAAADRSAAAVPDEFADTITDYAQVNHDSGLVKLFINPYAAIPSMHVAFSTMIGVTGVLDLQAHDHQGPLGRLPVPGLLGRRRDGEPLLGRRRLRPARRLRSRPSPPRQILARARPAVWSFRPATT